MLTNLICFNDLNNIRAPALCTSTMPLMDSSSLTKMFQFQWFPIIVASFFFLLILAKHLKQSKCRSRSKLPPGPKALPIIGNLHQLIGSLPHQALTRLSNKHGPVMKLQLGQLLAFVVSSPEAAREVFKTNEISFAQRPEAYAVNIMTYDLSSMFMSPCNDYWRNLRRISVFELLSTSRVQSFRSIREEEVSNLIEHISSSASSSQEGSCVNNVIKLGDKIFAMTSDIISRAAFGNKCKYQQDFISLVEEILPLAAGFSIVDLYPSLKFLCYLTGIKSKVLKIHKKMDKILEEIIAQHRMKRHRAANIDQNVGPDHQEDLLQTLLRSAESDHSKFHLTITQVKAIIQDIFFAASETSATSLEWVISELLKNPRVMNKAQEETRQACKGKSKIGEADIQKLDYLKAVIKETFRLHPPAPLNTRLATERCEISGYTVPAKAKIIVNNYAMGRDPTIWENPERFYPERFEGSPVDFKGNHFELLPFGGGRRICPGISFATSVIELGIAQLLYHFDWELANGIKLEELDMSESYRVTARRKEGLQVMATTRIPFHR